jgi:DNA-binding transcriptional MerR regulator
MLIIISVESEFTLAELAELLDMHPRTIRSYIERDLLRGPELGGRGARYTGYHVTRLQAIRALKDHRGLPVPEVRRRLLSVTGPELAALALEGAAPRKPEPSPDPGSALAYLRRMAPLTPSAPPPAPDPDAPTPLDGVLYRLDRATPGSKPQRRSRGEVWVSVPVTPDVEIRVRGNQTGEQLSRWERIADYLRELLIGGT